MGLQGVTYSTEKPNSAKYGTSICGLQAESSALKFEAESDLGKRNYDEAIRKAKKAVQFDCSNPETHATLAKCLTEKLYATGFDPKSPLYEQCMHEWKLLRWKCPDGFEQSDAAHQIAKLRMAKLTHKFRHRKDEQKAVDAKMLAEKRKTN